MAKRSNAVNAATKGIVDGGKVLFGADDSERKYTGQNGIETQMGKGMGVRNRHWAHGSSAANISNAYEQDARGGHVPMISLGGQGYSPQLVTSIAAGHDDKFWLDVFTGLKSPGLFRPWMEMNGSHNKYSGSASAYVKMWLHVYGLYAKVGHANLKWIFCPQMQDPRVEPWQKFWPGDQYVQWMGYDLYRHFFSAGDEFRLFANQKKMPFTLCETGFQQGVVVHDKATGATGDKDGSKTGTSLIQKTRADIVAHPNTVMYLVWNCTGPIGNNYIDSSKLSLEQYREFASDPHFQFSK